MAKFKAGDAVQTPLGKGTVRDIRNSDRVVVDVHDRAVVFREAEVSRMAARRPAASRRRPSQAASPLPAAAARNPATREIDLHGLTIAEALARADHALNDALLADFTELRFIHGRSGGRIRAALHQRLGAIPSVRAFELDPRNEGVTVVYL